MPKKIESRIFRFVGYAQSFKVDLIAMMQQKIETIGIIKAIFSSFQLFVYIMLRVLEKAKFLI